jgi:hypothetical protein
MRREKMSKFLRIFAPSFLMSSREKNIGFFIIFTLMFHISSVHINENHESNAHLLLYSACSPSWPFHRHGWP